MRYWIIRNKFGKKFVRQLFLQLGWSPFFSLSVISDPLSHKVAPMTDNFAQKIAKRLVLPANLGFLSLEKIKNPLNCLILEEIHFGFFTKQQWKKLFNNGIVSKNHYLTFCLTFYRQSLQYVLKKMGFTKRFWKHAVWIDFFEPENASWDDQSYLLESCTQLLNF